MDELKRERTRRRIIGEILSTEQSYVDSLALLESVFIKPLQAKLAAETVATLFSNIQVIAGLNKKLLGDLQVRHATWSVVPEDDASALSATDTLCDLFVQFAPFLKMYTQYAGQNGESMKTLRNLQESDETFAAFCDEASALCKGQTLDSFLIMPIQRIPRYLLLLSELKKYTPEQFSDYAPLQKAEELIGATAKHINEQVRTRENQQKLLDIQAELNNAVELVAPHRVFIRRGQLYKECRAHDELYEFLLFNDKLLYAAETPLGLKLHRDMPIDEHFAINDVPPQDNHHKFEIASSAKSFVVYTDNAVNKFSWLEDLNKQIMSFKTKIQGRRESTMSTRPVWKSDKTSNNCLICNDSFTLFNRKHHCRACGILCCDSCSKSRLPIAGVMERFCDPCARARSASTNKRDSIQSAVGLSIVAEDTNSASLPSPSPLSRQDSGDFSSQISDTSAPATPVAAAATPTQLVESSPLSEKVEEASNTVDVAPSAPAAEPVVVPDVQVSEPVVVSEPAPVPAKKSKPVPPPRPSAPRPNVKAALEQQASKPVVLSRQDSLKSPEEAAEHERMLKEREQLLKNVELEQQAKLAAKQQADARKEMEERQQEAVAADGKWASALGTLSSLSGTVLQTLGIDAATVDPIAVVTPVSSVLPEHKWVPDHTTNQCAVCCQEFSLLMRRRHHCRVCGTACCGDCSKTRLPLSLNDTVVYERACDQCVHKVKVAAESQLTSAPPAAQKLLGGSKTSPVANNTTVSAPMTPSSSFQDRRLSALSDFSMSDLKEVQMELMEGIDEASENADETAEVEKPAVVEPQPVAVSVPEDEATKKQRFRRRIADEILSTEQSYVDSLRTVLDVFLDSMKNVLNKQDVESIFCDLPLILDLNRKLLADLKQELQKDNFCVGSVFIKYAPDLKIYSQFAAHSEGGLRRLRVLNDPEEGHIDFLACVDICLADTRTAGMNLDSFLIKPIQRIPRYILLLAELRKHTPDTHADHALLKQAEDLICETAKHVNEQVRARENRDLILGVQCELGNVMELVTAGRVYVRRGVLTKKCRASDITYEFILFSDLLIYASVEPVVVRGRRLKLHQVLNVDKHFSVGDMSDLLTAKQFRFQIVSSTKSFVVYSDNAVDKQAWLTDLNKCIELCRQSTSSNDSKSAVRPIWQQDHESSHCRLCDNSFSFLNRRHHCRRCGILCCGSCSQARLALVAGGALERHCDTCRRELDSAAAQPETSEVTQSRTANRGNSFASSVQSFSEQLPPTESLILQQNPMHLTVRDDEVLIAGVESDDDDQEPEEIVRRQSVTAPPPSTTAGSSNQLDTVTEEEQFPIEVFAKVDFEGDDESVEDGSELHYQIADTIMVTAKDESGWWLGENLRTKSVGWFCADHVVTKKFHVRNAPVAVTESVTSEKAAAEKAAVESVQNSATVKAAADNAVQEKAAQDKAASEKAAAEKNAAEQAAMEKALLVKAAQEKAAAEKADAEKAAEEKAAAELAAKAAAEKAAFEKAAAELAAKAAAEKAAFEKAASEAAEKADAEKAAEAAKVVAAEQAAAEIAAAAKAEADKAAEQAATEKAAIEAAEKALAEKTAAEATAKAVSEAVEKAAAEKLAAEKAAAKKAEAEKAAMEKAATEAAEKVAFEKAEAEKAAAEKAAAEKAATEKAAAEKIDKPFVPVKLNKVESNPAVQAAPAASSAGKCTQCECDQFFPHAFKKDRCRECPHSRAEH